MNMEHTINRHIVLISASSGGGHNSAANAIKEIIQDRHGDHFEFKVIDIYEKNLLSNLPFMSKVRYKSDWLWGKFVSLTNNKFMVSMISAVMKPYMLRTIKNKIPNTCTHLIAVHFNPAQYIKSLAESLPKAPKTNIVVTDFDPHWAWIGKGADDIFIASNAGIEKAISIGYSEKNVNKLSIIPTNTLPHKCGREIGPPVRKFIIVSGNDGSNEKQIIKIISILDSIKTAHPINIDVFCGNNTSLAKNIKKTSSHCERIEVKTHAYTENLKTKFHQYDLAIIRTSPGVLSECISSAVPVLGFEWSYHEDYQAKFINENGIGYASKDPRLIKDFFIDLLSNNDTLDNLNRKASQLRGEIDNKKFLEMIIGSKEVS